MSEIVIEKSYFAANKNLFPFPPVLFYLLQILFYEPIACYLPDKEAVPQGVIFSPLSQRVASLMLEELGTTPHRVSTLSPQGKLLR